MHASARMQTVLSYLAGVFYPSGNPCTYPCMHVVKIRYHNHFCLRHSEPIEIQFAINQSPRRPLTTLVVLDELLGE